MFFLYGLWQHLDQNRLLVASFWIELTKLIGFDLDISSACVEGHLSEASFGIQVSTSDRSTCEKQLRVSFILSVYSNFPEPVLVDHVVQIEEHGREKGDERDHQVHVDAQAVFVGLVQLG